LYSLIIYYFSLRCPQVLGIIKLDLSFSSMWSQKQLILLLILDTLGNIRFLWWLWPDLLAFFFISYIFYVDHSSFHISTSLILNVYLLVKSFEWTFAYASFQRIRNFSISIFKIWFRTAYLMILVDSLILRYWPLLLMLHHLIFLL
jgi:hypothetical protein